MGRAGEWMTKAKPKCPECNHRFSTNALLAMHRKRAHGVEGTSKSHLQAQAKKARLEAVVETKPKEEPATATIPNTSPALLTCPDCPATFTKAVELGKHRRFKHGVFGRHSDALIRRQALERSGGGFPCSDCEFIATSIGGLSLHRGKQHKDALPPVDNPHPKSRGTELARTKTTRPIASNGNGHHSEEAHFAANGIPEATLALALGRFQGLCQGMAVEFDLPPRLFASRLAELIYRSQVR